jgi:hypothetical protein
MGNGLKYIGDFDCDDPSSGAGRHLLPKGEKINSLHHIDSI